MLSRQFIILILMYRHAEKLKRRANAPTKHSRYRKTFFNSLNAYERRIRRRYIPRPSLHLPSMCAWRTLYASKQDQALITLTGLDFATFDWLADKFAALYDTHSPWIDQTNGNIVPLPPGQKGKPRMVSAIDCLGLCLAWTRTRGSSMILQMIFGLTLNPVSMYLRFGRRIVIEVLSKEPETVIKVPSIDKIRQYQDIIRQRHPLLDGCWCTMDGLKLKIQQPADRVTENNFYNGWKHDHYVGAVIVFCPDGTIPIVCYNVPGCVHDSLIAEWGSIYDKLGRVYDLCGGTCTVDSAFSARRNNYLIKSGQTNLVGETRAELAANIRLNAEATSMRQSAEWGMRTLEASFPRLKDRFIYEERGERRRIMQMCFLLYNLRARRVGINQIHSVYVPALNVNANDHFR
jgi:DDE superfamily endonuclease